MFLTWNEVRASSRVKWTQAIQGLKTWAFVEYVVWGAKGGIKKEIMTPTLGLRTLRYGNTGLLPTVQEVPKSCLA